MFERFMNMKQIRSYQYFSEEPAGDLDPGVGGGEGDPNTDLNPETNPDPNPAPVAFEVPEGQVLMSKEQADLMTWYQQYGTPQDLYNNMQEFNQLKGKVSMLNGNGPAVDPQRKEELGQVQNLLYEAVPGFKEFVDKGGFSAPAAPAQGNNIADAAAGMILQSATNDKLELKTDVDKHELLTLVTSAIRRDPVMHSRLRAGDLSVVNTAYTQVAERFFGKAPTQETPNLAPASKRRAQPMRKGSSPSGVIDDSKVPVNMEEAGERGFERLQNLMKE